MASFFIGGKVSSKLQARKKPTFFNEVFVNKYTDII